MTSYKVTWLRFLKQRHLLLAYIYGIRASWMKSAACRRVNKFGTLPGIATSSLLLSRRGTALSKDSVYGCFGLRNMVLVSADSEIWPAYITVTYSVVSAITPIS